jgi:hypothetical protein
VKGNCLVCGIEYHSIEEWLDHAEEHRDEPVERRAPRYPDPRAVELRLIRSGALSGRRRPR